MLRSRKLHISAGPRRLVSDLDLIVRRGDLVAVLGPNGSGKSLTLHTLAGLRPPTAGTVLVDQDPITNLPRSVLARRLGLLLQEDGDTFPGAVLDSVLLGRYPHRPAFGGPAAEDVAMARRALTIVHLESLAERDTGSLSGGERRRLGIARLLAQETEVLLLDEPTNHLDPRHQLQVMRILAGLASDGRAIVATLHDPYLALRFAPLTLLLFGDGRWRFGPTSEVLTAATLAEVFVTPYEEFRSAGDGQALLPATDPP